MTTVVNNPQIALREPASLPALRIADQGVASALESLLSGNTRRVYAAQWRLFNDWCDEVGLQSMPADPLTVARYLAVRAGDGASIATMRLVSSAIAKLDFTHFKQYERGSLRVADTARPGVPECLGQLRTVKNLPTPATGGAAPERGHPLLLLDSA